MTYTNLAFDQNLPALYLASKPEDTRVILADFIEGKVLSQDTKHLELPTVNHSATLKDVARSVYQQYGIFSNPSHYQNLGLKQGTHYFLCHVNSHTHPLQGEWINLTDINNGTIPSSRKIKSLLEQIIYTIN